MSITSITKPWGNFPPFVRITFDCFCFHSNTREHEHGANYSDFLDMENLKDISITYEIKRAEGKNEWSIHDAFVDAPHFAAQFAKGRLDCFHATLPHGQLIGSQLEDTPVFTLLYFQNGGERWEGNISFIELDKLHSCPTRIIHFHEDPTAIDEDLLFIFGWAKTWHKNQWLYDTREQLKDREESLLVYRLVSELIHVREKLSERGRKGKRS